VYHVVHNIELVSKVRLSVPRDDMPRPREFDLPTAVDRGTHLLWSKGYEATSLDDLLLAMGIGKSSFYALFRTKRDFLFKAIDHYSDQVVEQLFGNGTEGSAYAAIARTFESVIDRAGMEGCFLQNCAIELAHRDAETRVSVRRGLRRLEKAYYDVVVRGQGTGEIRKSADPLILSRYLTASLNGLQTLARVERDRNALRQVAQTALSVLK
jgi:TetR/AcrR family transcriptional regulator, transcriptional repressor for nem operon